MTISIRPFCNEDIEDFYCAVCESVDHVSPWLPWCTPEYSRDRARSWVNFAAQSWQAGTDYCFVITDSATGRLLGSVGIHHVVPALKRGHLGYWVRASALGQGVCTQAARQALAYGFAQLGFVRLEVWVHPDNTASNAVAAKLGGSYEGCLRNGLILRGTPCAAHCYSVIPSDYSL